MRFYLTTYLPVQEGRAKAKVTEAQTLQNAGLLALSIGAVIS